MFTAMLQASLGRSMEMSTSARSNGYSSVESGVDHVVHSWVPPIAPTESSAAEHSFLHEQTVAATPEDEQLFQSAEQSDLHQILRGSGSERKLIVCTAAVAALAVGALAYVFWSTAVDKKEYRYCGSRSSIAIRIRRTRSGGSANPRTISCRTKCGRLARSSPFRDF